MSDRALQNTTNTFKAQLEFLQNDLKHERLALATARTWLKYNLPGTKSMIISHTTGVKKTRKDLALIKARIRRYQKNGWCNKIF